MSRIVKVSESNYKLQVASGGTITLDTGAQTGTVVVTGDLTVLGNTTTVYSETMTIEDNTIVLNNGETSSSGISLVTSGVEMYRGPVQSAAQLFFAENLSHYNPGTGTTKTGTFVFKDASGLLRGIRTNSISTGGANLALINTGTGVVTVTGTTDYETQVQAGDDDVLVNKGWVTRYVAATGYPSGVALTDRFYRADTGMQAYDNSLDGGTSRIEIEFDNVVKSTLSASSFNINTDLNINGKTLIRDNEISADDAGDNLILTPAVGMHVEFNGHLQLNDQTDPTADSGSTKLYSKSANDTGNTGLFFVNTTNQDELIARNRALLWSMLF